MMLLHSGVVHGIAPRIVGILGLGLIGSAITESLRKRRFQPFHFQKLTWNSTERLHIELLDACDPLRRGRVGVAYSPSTEMLGKHDNPSGGPIELIWCAGRAGFAATDHEIDLEFAAFDIVLRWAEQTANSLGVPIHVSMISSAGGLYEGQRRVDAQSPCRPCRPYGRLKMNQERRLLESPSLSRRRVFRPSSIYGWLRPGQRKGLIPTLIHNGLRNQETVFVGSLNTLRDYVWVDDVAEYVVRTLFRESDGESEFSSHIIASGQPCSIFQIKHLVETAIGRHVQVRFVSRVSNDLDTTFSAGQMTEVRDDWQPTDMNVAIRRIAADFACNGLRTDR